MVPAKADTAGPKLALPSDLAEAKVPVAQPPGCSLGKSQIVYISTVYCAIYICIYIYIPEAPIYSYTYIYIYSIGLPNKKHIYIYV